MEGFVTKRGHLITNWKVRWFVLENGEIRYYKDRAGQVMKGRYILRPESILSFHSDMGLNKNIILIFTTSHPFRKKALYFSCDSPESKDLWFQALTSSVQALKNGGVAPVPAPTNSTNLPSIPLPGVVLANAIDSIANAFTSASDKQEAEDTAVLTAMTNNSNLERGRARARPKSGARDQSPVRAERSRSVDLNDRRQAGPNKPVKNVGAIRRLNPTGLANTSSTDMDANNTTNNTYTAADYDSSDTDGSMVEGDGSGTRDGRSKSSSDAPKMRPLSSGKPSPHASQASNGHSAAMLSEAATSPVLQRVAQRRSGTDNVFSTTSSSSPVPTSPTPATVPSADDLPRVSEIVADEAHLTNNKKVAPISKTGAHSPKPAASAESANEKQEAPIKPPKNSSAVPNKPSKAEKPSSPVNNSDNSGGAVETDNPWIEAYTPEGELYYYHKVSRLARWDKPDSHIVEAMESRMKDLDLASERSIKERKEAIERAKQREAESESIKTEKNAEIEKNVRAWSLDKQRAGRELSFPELLRDLAFILPPDLLLVVYDSQHKVILDALQEFSVNSPPTEVKKAYLRVVRFIHPDKLPTDLEIASKFLVERVFIHLTQKYDLYRKAHDLG